MITINEHIKNLVDANAKHIAEITTESEARDWLNSLLWSVAGFKQTINEEELDGLAWSEYPDDDDDDTLFEGIDRYDYREAYKAGCRKAIWIIKGV